MTLPEEIYLSDLPKEIKIVRLWAITQINYRQQYGDLALECLHKILDNATVSAIFWITGYSFSGFNIEKFKSLVPDYNEEEARKYNIQKR